MTVETTTVIIRNPSGLHARPANELARLAKSLPSAVSLHVGERTVNAASVLSIMTLGVQTGQLIEVTCEGDHAADDLAALVAAIESGLGELDVPGPDGSAR